MSKTANIKSLPDATPEPVPRRRSFTAEYKARILVEADAAVEPGKIGALLRREGLYSSHLVEWRRRRAQGGIDGLAPKKMGRPPKNPAERGNEKELDRLRRENARLQAKLKRSEIIVEAQKKLAEVLASLPHAISETDE